MLFNKVIDNTSSYSFRLSDNGTFAIYSERDNKSNSWIKKVFNTENGNEYDLLLDMKSYNFIPKKDGLFFTEKNRYR